MTPHVSRARNRLAHTMDHAEEISSRAKSITPAGSRRSATRACAPRSQAAHIILTRPVKASALKSWAMQLAKRIGMAKAKVALARKLAVILHRMLVEGKPFDHKLPNQVAAA